MTKKSELKLTQSEIQLEFIRINLSEYGKVELKLDTQIDIIKTHLEKEKIPKDFYLPEIHKKIKECILDDFTIEYQKTKSAKKLYDAFYQDF